MKKLLTATAVLLLAACSQGEPVQGAPLEPSTYVVPSFEWRVENQKGMEAAYEEAGGVIQRPITVGKDKTGGEKLSGFVGRTASGQWVVYTRAPTFVDDEATCVLGHEVLHIMLGDYHQ